MLCNRKLQLLFIIQPLPYRYYFLWKALRSKWSRLEPNHILYLLYDHVFQPWTWPFQNDKVLQYLSIWPFAVKIPPNIKAKFWLSLEPVMENLTTLAIRLAFVFFVTPPKIQPFLGPCNPWCQIPVRTTYVISCVFSRPTPRALSASAGTVFIIFNWPILHLIFCYGMDPALQNVKQIREKIAQLSFCWIS